MNISGKSLDSLLDEILDGILKEDQQQAAASSPQSSAPIPIPIPAASSTSNSNSVTSIPTPNSANNNKQTNTNHKFSSTTSQPLQTTEATSNTKANSDIGHAEPKVAVKESEQSAAASSFLGKTVIVKNLQARSELNGEVGIVQEDLNNGRVKVYLLRTGSSISIKHENIILSNNENEIIEEVSVDNNAQHQGVARIHAQNTLLSFTSTTRHWETKPSFQPFGDSSARHLTSHIPVNQPVINILLLACGDFRHMLYTLWCMQQNATQQHQSQQALNFVAVDLEPSILARNILLLQLIFSGNYSSKQLWMIFYSKLIDNTCLDMIVTSSQTLLSAGASVHAWHDTEFGKIIRFCNQTTYENVRSIWEIYSRGKILEESIGGAVSSKSEQDCSNKENVVLTAVMQAQPCILDAFQNTNVHSKLLNQYNEGKETFNCIYGGKLDSSNSFHNPLMLRGTLQQTELQFGVDPTCGYHLALAYTQLVYGPSFDAKLESKKEQQSSIDKDRILQVCFQEFSDWCRAFRIACVKPCVRLKIHVFSGDAMDFCQDLINIRTFGAEKGGFMGNGELRLQSLLREFPTEFDVVDTSNLSDYIGLLNVLLMCRNVMKANSNSTIFTDLLSSSALSNNLEDVLEELLCMNLTTLSTLTGITLVNSFNRCSNNFHNFASIKLLASMIRRKDLRLEWKFISPHNCIRMEMSPADFVLTLSGIYKKMFELYLGLANSLFDDQTSLEKFVQNALNLSHGQHDFAQPGAQLFARFVRVTSEHLFQVKKETILALLSEVRNCGHFGQSNYAQEMFVWFTLFGLIEMNDLAEMVTGVIQGYTLSWKSSRLLYFARNQLPINQSLSRSAAINPPKLLLVTLLVPKSVLVEQLGKLTSPILEMSICAGMTTQNGFNSFHMGYVKQVVRPGEKVDMDANDSIVHFQHFSVVSGNINNCKYISCSAVVPISALVIDAPANIRVELRLHYSMVRKSRDIIKMFGPLLVLHSTPLSDTKHVSWCAYEDQFMAIVPPPLSVMYNHISNRSSLTLEQEGRASNKLKSDKISSSSTANISPMECHGIREVQFTSLAINPSGLKNEENGHFQCKLSFEDPSILATCQPELVYRPCPSQVRLLLQDSPSMQFVDLRLSVLVDIAQSRMQISRNKGYINILFTPLRNGSCPERITHVFRENLCLSQFHLLGISRLNLESMPKINNYVDGSKLNWLGTIAAAQLDHKERYAESAVKTALGSWKETVHALTMYFTGQQEPGVYKRLFGLSSSTAFGVEIVIFLNSIRLDFFSHSVVLDVAMCVVDYSQGQTIKSWCDSFDDKTGLNVLNVSADEMLLWKKLLPALAERARSNYEHVHGRCEYCATGSSGSAGGDYIPRISYLSCCQPVVCSCVLGKGLEGTEFEAIVGKSRHKAVYKNFFRAAISPIFNAFESSDTSKEHQNKKSASKASKTSVDNSEDQIPLPPNGNSNNTKSPSQERSTNKPNK